MTQPGDIYTFGPFRLDVASRTLLRGDEAVALTAKAFDTLAILLRHHDRVVEKEELVKLVWPDTFVSDDSLTHSISVLRRALGDDSAQPVYIVTIPRRGYRFTAPVHAQMTFAETQADTNVDAPIVSSYPTPPALVASQEKSTRAHARRAWLVWVLIVIPIAGIALAMRLLGAPAGVVPGTTIRFVQDAPPAHVLAGVHDNVGLAVSY